MVFGSGKKSKKAENIVTIKKDWEPDVTVPPVIDDNEDEEPVRSVVSHSTRTKDIVAELCKQRAIPSGLESQLQEYFEQHPRIHPLASSSSGSNTVDIDLADPEEETWIIQCPATIKVRAELNEKKINLAAARSRIKHCSVPLEAQVQYNKEERVIGLLSGSRVKSFVPTGFVRINQVLPSLDVPELSSTSNANNIAVPYPDEIRVRHPLLGYDFNDHMKLSKRVQKQLSFAQQKAALIYQNAGKKHTAQKKKDTAVDPTTEHQQTVSSYSESVDQSTPTKTKKRKQSAVVLEAIKQEPLSPKQKKKKNNDEVQAVNVKKEVMMEDDISWLLNI
uniref:Uncharacterized protein n=1 Tax=Anopheles minimus TaxID=112268 RepID=A0A182W329_9DIPT